MLKVGTYNNLKLKKKTFEGLILTEGENEILLPFAELREGDEEEEVFFVFVYHNKEGRLVATTKRPYACSGDFAYLKVVGTSDHGAFADIGLSKDVIVPKREQRHPMVQGNSYVMFLYNDKFDNMLCASSWLEDFIPEGVPTVEEGDEVTLLIAERSDLGFTAVINNKYLGLLYHNELYEDLEIGEVRQGYVKKIRDNNKIDLSLRVSGFDYIIESRDTMLQYIKDQGGVIHLGDKSDPEEIHNQLRMSKKAFKQIIGGLYKQRLVTISDYEVKLVDGNV